MTALEHTTGSEQRPRTIATLAAIVVIALVPLLIFQGSDNEFAGADAKATAKVERIAPDHEAWINPIWTPPGGETEGALFALQAAVGAGVLGYVAGVVRTRHRLKAPSTG